MMTAIYLGARAHARSAESGRGEGVTGMFLTVSSPAAVSLNPHHRHRHQRAPPPPPAPSTQRLTMKPIQRDRKCLLLTGGPIKAAIIPVSDFFTGNGFSENMPAVQAERRIIVMQVASVFLPPPFTPCQPPSLFFFILSFSSPRSPTAAAANKRTHRPRRDHVHGTLSPLCALEASQALSSFERWGWILSAS